MGSKQRLRDANTKDTGGMMPDATDITTSHYQRPAVKNIILKLCEFNHGLRALNGGDGWYTYESNNVKLRGVNNYDDTILRARTLYMTADVFDPNVFNKSEEWVVGRGNEGHPVEAIGTRGDLISYSLFADIDAIKDPNGPEGSKLYHEGRIDALNDAAAYIVQYFENQGLSDSVGLLFSGQGIYCLLHPGLSDVSAIRSEEFDVGKLDYDFKIWLDSFNALLYNIEQSFFDLHPEHKGRVKFDKLNNQKRKIKCLLSIHKSVPFAVVPLDKNNPSIDLEAARISLDGLRDDTIANAGRWLEEWRSSDDERKALIKLLEPYKEQAEKEITMRSSSSDDISRLEYKCPVDEWCPFYQNLLKFEGGEGAHRVCGALAAWLYQARWDESDAFDLWYDVAARCGVESRIFYTSYGVIFSPSCSTIKKTSAGYPSLGFGGLNLCEPDDNCKLIKWPGHYGGKMNTDDYKTTRTISVEELSVMKPNKGPEFKINLPKSHYLSRYIAYGRDMSDAYPDYWFAGGLFQLAVISDKKLWIKLRQGPVYPNLYIFIAGRSSLTHKSTVVDASESLLQDQRPGTAVASVPTEFSPEAFIEHLDGCPHAPWVRDEAAGVLSTMRRDYMRGFKDSLMQLYDCRPIHRKLRTNLRSKNKTTFDVDDPYLNVFWATTDSSLAANTEVNDTLSGFMARFIYSFPRRPKERWLPLEEGDAMNSELEIIVREQLTSMYNIIAVMDRCQLSFSKDAAHYWTEWQRQRAQEIEMRDDSNEMQIHSRLVPLVAKLGILFELGSIDFDPIRPIRLEYVVEACRLVDEYYQPMAMSVYDMVGRDLEKNIIDRVIAFLKRHGGISTKREISRHVKIKAKELQEYLDTMAGDGTIEYCELVPQGGGRPSVKVLLSVNNVINDTNVYNVTNVTSNTKYDKLDDDNIHDNNFDSIYFGDMRDSRDIGDIGDKSDKKISKIEMKYPDWRNIGDADELKHAMEKFDGRITYENMVKECGWSYGKCEEVIGKLIDKYGWESEVLVSGLMVYRPPTEI